MAATVPTTILGAAVDPAMAHPWDPTISCGLSNKNGFVFSSDAEWSLTDNTGITLQSRAQAGIQQWNGPKSLAGTNYFNLQPNSSSPVLLKWGPLDPGTYASTDCAGSGSITFNSNLITDYRTTTGFMAAMSRHEMGHSLWLRKHPGIPDSLVSNHPPVMATCMSAAQNASISGLEGDDEAALGMRWEPGIQMVNANAGFEIASTSRWKAYNAAVAAITTTNPKNGSRALRLQASDNANFSQTRNLARPPGGIGYIRGNASVRYDQPSDGGNANVSVWVKQVEYTSSTTGCATNNFITGRDQNTRINETLHQTVLATQMTVTPIQGQWLSATTSSVTFDPTWVSADVSLTITTNALNNGVKVPLVFDDLFLSWTANCPDCS